jgi:hypothetical protein
VWGLGRGVGETKVQVIGGVRAGRGSQEPAASSQEGRMYEEVARSQGRERMRNGECRGSPVVEPVNPPMKFGMRNKGGRNEKSC